MASSNDFENVNNLTSIYELVSKYVKLDKVGKNYRGLCPFHAEKEPSFYVNPEINVAKCMGCGEGGKPIKFLSLIEKIPLSHALKKLADLAGYKLELKSWEKNDTNLELVKIMEKSLSFYRQVLKRAKIGDIALDYLNKRGLSDDIIEHFNLGYSPNDATLLPKFLEKDNINLDKASTTKVIKKGEKCYFDFLHGRVIFPIYDKFKNLIAFSGRSLKADDNIKYLNLENSKLFEKGKTLFNINNLELGKPIYIVEGFFDVISMYKAGINNAISQMGTSLSDYNCKSLKDYSKEIIMLYDGDNAGFNAVLNNYEILLKNKFIVYVVLLNDLDNLKNKIDPDLFINKFGKDKFNEYIKNNKKDIFSFLFDHYKNNYNLNDNNMLNEFLKKIRHVFSYANPEIRQKYENLLKELVGFSVSLKNTYSINNIENDKINSKSIKGPRTKELDSLNKHFMYHILHQELSYIALQIYSENDISRYIKDERVNYIYGLFNENKDILYEGKTYDENLKESKFLNYDTLQNILLDENSQDSDIIKLYTDIRNKLDTELIGTIATTNIKQNVIKYKKRNCSNEMAINKKIKADAILNGDTALALKCDENMKKIRKEQERLAEEERLVSKGVK